MPKNCVEAILQIISTFKKEKVMYKLYLDDERFPKTEGWIIVRSFNEFKKTILERGLPNKISFDHDLGRGGFIWRILRFFKRIWNRNLSKFPPTGYDCVKWMVDEMYDLRPIEINVHSANGIGKENIEGLVKSWNKFMDAKDEG